MQHAVCFADAVPALIHGASPERRALRVQHALGRGRGAGCVDEEGGILGGGVGVTRRVALRAACGRWRRHRIRAGRPGISLKPRSMVERNRFGVAVLQKEPHLVLGELRRGRQRHEAAGDGAEEHQRIGARVLQANKDPRAGLEARRLQPAGDTQHRVLELGERPYLRRRLSGIGDDQQRCMLRPCRRCAADGVGRHVEARRKRGGSVGHFAPADHQLSTL